MKKRKKGGILVALALAAACLPTAALAFLTARQEVVNQAVMGENTTTVEESFEEPKPLEPQGKHEITKEIRAKNQENVPCYFRIRIFQENTEVACAWKDLDETLWKKRGEYYYYTKIVEPGESTAPLAGTLVLEKTGEDAGEKFRILVYEESIQAFHPETGENWEWLEAWQHYVGEEGGVA